MSATRSANAIWVSVDSSPVVNSEMWRNGSAIAVQKATRLTGERSRASSDCNVTVPGTDLKPVRDELDIGDYLLSYTTALHI